MVAVTTVAPGELQRGSLAQVARPGSNDGAVRHAAVHVHGAGAGRVIRWGCLRELTRAGRCHAAVVALELLGAVHQAMFGGQDHHAPARSGSKLTRKRELSRAIKLKSRTGSGVLRAAAADN